jgi:hypothetical protein
MAFLAAKGRSFLTFGRSTGKHAARRGMANTLPRPDEQRPKPRRAAHAASVPRLTNSHNSHSHNSQGKAA